MLIQKLRLQRGWSQDQLADISNLSVRTIQRIERGQTASLETMKALASVFEIDIARLTETKETDVPVAFTDSGEAEEANAFTKARRVKRHYLRLMQYAVVIALLAIINLVTSPGYLWFLWPALGWGIGMIVQALRTLDRIPFLRP